MRKRNYKAEYKRRIRRGLARGLTRAQARGHAKKHVRKAADRARKFSPQFETAVRELNRGSSLAAAARASAIPAQQLRHFLTASGLGRPRGRGWVMNDNRLRRVPVMTGGRFRVLTVRGYKAARLVGEHHQAAGQFVRSNDVQLLKRFKGRSVQAAGGRQYPLETDPNALHRIAAMDSPPFHEIYEITSNT